MCVCVWSRVSSVGIAMSYVLDGRDSNPGRINFSLLQNVQTGSGVHPASYPMGPGALSPTAKRSVLETDH
jgi:hypothetical protein